MVKPAAPLCHSTQPAEFDASIKQGSYSILRATPLLLKDTLCEQSAFILYRKNIMDCLHTGVILYSQVVEINAKVKALDVPQLYKMFRK